jgi:hypothetical protein
MWSATVVSSVWRSHLLLQSGRASTGLQSPSTLLLAAFLASVLIGFGRSNLEPRFAMASHYAIGRRYSGLRRLLPRRPPKWRETDKNGKAAWLVTATAVSPLRDTSRAISRVTWKYERSRNLQMALASLDGDVGKDVSQFLHPR